MQTLRLRLRLRSHRLTAADPASIHRDKLVLDLSSADMAEVVSLQWRAIVIGPPPGAAAPRGKMGATLIPFGNSMPVSPERSLEVVAFQPIENHVGV